MRLINKDTLLYELEENSSLTPSQYMECWAIIDSLPTMIECTQELRQIVFERYQDLANKHMEYIKADIEQKINEKFKQYDYGLLDGWSFVLDTIDGMYQDEVINKAERPNAKYNPAKDRMMWEIQTMMMQLEELGYGFAERIWHEYPREKPEVSGTYLVTTDKGAVTMTHYYAAESKSFPNKLDKHIVAWTRMPKGYKYA